MPSDQTELDPIQQHVLKELSPLLQDLMPNLSGAREYESARIFLGFPTKDPQPGYTRLYSAISLSEYLRIPDGDILGQEVVGAEEAPLRPSAVWVNEDAELEYTRLDNLEQEQANFLTGAVATGWSSASLVPLGGMAGAVGDEERVAPAVIASIRFCAAATAALYSFLR